MPRVRPVLAILPSGLRKTNYVQFVISKTSIAQRYLLAILSSLLVVIALFWLMQSLISNADKTLDTSANISFLDFIRVKPIKKATEYKKPTPPKAIPKTPDLPDLAKSELALDDLSTVRLNIKPSLNIDSAKFVMSASEGDYTPLVRIAPIYPQNARRRGIEGNCIVQFDVSAQGTTKNIEILDCDSTYFHRSSINATSRFRYRPRIIDGKPVEVRGVKTRFSYRLDQ